ncbi:MAG: hypothetical protein ACYTE5_05190 [Planctomycetota bacterium]|jgi:hypothetical protein
MVTRRSSKKSVRNKTLRKKPTEDKNLLPPDDDRGEILGTTRDEDGTEINITKWHLNEIRIPASPIAGADELGGEIKRYFNRKFSAVRLALLSRSKELQDEAIDTMLGDLIVGAYQDKLVIYTRTPSGHGKNSLEALKELQRARQAADTHLLNIIKAIRDIKRPPVNVMIKQADQVNVGEQINQGDKQVNIAQNQQSV